MRKTLLIISLGMSMAYADSEERSWTEKAMDIGREIKYSVEVYIDAFAMSVLDHYDGLTKGAHYWYEDGYADGMRKDYEDGYFACYNQSQKTFQDGYDKGYHIGNNEGVNDNASNDGLRTDDDDNYSDCFNRHYQEGYFKGYQKGYDDQF